MNVVAQPGAAGVVAPEVPRASRGSRSGSGVPSPAWDEELRRLGGHVLQSCAWASFQEGLGHTPLFASAPGWSWLGFCQRGRGARYLYCPAGPTFTGGENLEAALQSVEAAARGVRADFVRLEPRGTDLPADWVRARGLHSVRPVQPAHTHVVDLDASEAKLLSALAGGHRSHIRSSARRGIRVRQSSDRRETKTFLAMMNETSTANGFRAHSARYFEVMLATLLPIGTASLYLAETEATGPVASAIGLDFGGSRSYAHAAAHQVLNRKLHAAAPLVWTMMLDARRGGMEHFDLYGVSPPGQPGHPWAGLSQFKRGFGGRHLENLGTWELPVNSLRHLLHRTGRRLLR